MDRSLVILLTNSWQIRTINNVILHGSDRETDILLLSILRLLRGCLGFRAFLTVKRMSF